MEGTAVEGTAQSDVGNDEEFVTLGQMRRIYDHLASTTTIRTHFGKDFKSFFDAWKRMKRGQNRWEKYTTLVNLGASIPSFLPLFVTFFDTYGFHIEQLYYATSATIGPILTIFIVQLGNYLRRRVERDRALLKSDRPYIQKVLEMYKNNRNPDVDDRIGFWGKEIDQTKGKKLV